MKRSFGVVLLVALLLVSYNGSFGWGVWGHQHINKAAIFALPLPMRTFFFNHADFMTIEAPVPDVRKYTIHDTNEGPRHYIDLEAFGEHPFDVLPETWDSAKAKYGEQKLIREGILPWYIQEITGKLTGAFRDHDKVRILFLAADLAHYIGDAHMPLHTSLNHDGQLTGQRGIHALWESLLPELFGSSYDLHVPEARYIKDPVKETWDILRESHGQVQTLLSTEKKLLDTWPKSEIYEVDSAGNILRNKYNNARFTRDFAAAYHKALGGMVAHQMRLAIGKSADFWYTAWVNAGKPDLNGLDDSYTRKINRKPLRYQYKLWKKRGKLAGVKPLPEF